MKASSLVSYVVGFRVALANGRSPMGKQYKQALSGLDFLYTVSIHNP